MIGLPRDARDFKKPGAVVMGARPKLSRIAEEMKQWSALLESEIASWPGVTSRRMFGMTVFYCGGSTFAALPRTRSFETPRSIGFKFCHRTARLNALLKSDPRIAGTFRENEKWISMELSAETELSDALKWLELAYEQARKIKNRR